jgi:phosphotransferase system enzyme I (PtsI)
MRSRQARLARELRNVPPETKDGYRVELFANIEFPEEIPSAIEHGAEGVGLYRTEYLYLQKGHMPTEEEHFEAYRRAAELLAPRPLTIRTLDMGADKLADESGAQRERNPFLGCRSIRLSLEREELFRTQIRAILRASSFGNVRVLFPLISTLGEVLRAKAIVRDVMSQLEREEVPFDPNAQIGIMLEVPGALLIADVLAQHSDFFSLGTNDLVQYSLAVDRGNERVANLYQPAHPAILRLVKQVIETGHRLRVRVGMCGEMSGDLYYTILLLGLGLKDFSLAPAVLPEVKELIRQVTMSDARAIARRALAFEQAEQTVQFLTEKTKEILPDIP